VNHKAEKKIGFFPVEIGKLLNEMVILKKDRTSGSNGHGGVVVPYRSTRVAIVYYSGQ
jgi:hypothetical protein